MKTSLLHKDGVELLVEETAITNDIEKQLDDAKEKTVSKIPGGESKEFIIELRNEQYIRDIETPEMVLGNIMKNIGKVAFAKTVYFGDAISEVFKINLILGTKYSLNDVFIGANIEKIDTEKSTCGGNLKVNFDKINFEIVDKYKNVVSKYITYCHECLFGDIYDKEVLVKYLPVVYFLIKYSERY